MSDNTVINMNGVTKTFGSVVALDNVSMQIKRGEIFGFLGQNGAGKTTAMRCVLNILIPDNGNITIDETPVDRDHTSIRDKVGYLPGELFIPGHYRVREFIDYIASLKKVPSTRKEEIIKLFDVEDAKKVSELSKGNKQKIGIVLAFMADPEILILDEPSSGLDPIYQQKLYDLIFKEKKRGKTIFFSSHNLDEVQRICDRVTIIRKGKIITTESVEGLSGKIPRTLIAKVNQFNEEQLKSLPNISELDKENKQIKLKISKSENLQTILKQLIEFDVEDISYPPVSLEEYFLSEYN